MESTHHFCTILKDKFKSRRFTSVTSSLISISPWSRELPTFKTWLLFWRSKVVLKITLFSLTALSCAPVCFNKFPPRGFKTHFYTVLNALVEFKTVLNLFFQTKEMSSSSSSVQTSSSPELRQRRQNSASSPAASAHTNTGGAPSWPAAAAAM